MRSSKKLTWQEQDRILVKRFRLTEEELAAGREFRAFCPNAALLDCQLLRQRRGKA